MRFRPNTYCFVLVLCCLLRVMSSRFKCADMCGRTFTEPRSLSCHQDVCVSWRRHLSSRVEQRQQAAALVHSTDRDEERDPKRQKLNSDQPIRVSIHCFHSVSDSYELFVISLGCRCRPRMLHRHWWF
ncbi:hypothetical protein V8E55_005208 [Tylopilus felleus]